MVQFFDVGTVVVVEAGNSTYLGESSFNISLPEMFVVDSDHNSKKRICNVRTRSLW